jgi:hypothetical protein
MTTTALFLAEAANGLSLFEDLGADAEPRALCFNRATRPHLPEATWFSANPSFDVRPPPPPASVSPSEPNWLTARAGLQTSRAYGGVHAISQPAAGHELPAAPVR